MKSRVRAFTLIELLVVVSIILVLSTLTFINLGSTRAKSRDEQRISSAQLVGSALDQYAMSHSRKLPVFLAFVQQMPVPTGSPNKYYTEVINPKAKSSCSFCSTIEPYINPVPDDSISTTTSSNMKYIFNGDGSKAAVIIDKMESGTKLCNIDKNNAGALPDPVQAYMGVGGELSFTGDTNSNPCYYVSK